MLTFVPAIPLPHGKRTTSDSSCPPRRARCQGPSILRASGVHTASDGVVRLKERSVIALRGLSDLGGIALLNEFWTRVLSSSNPGQALAADAELLLGGLIGMWTAAVFAERLRRHTQSLVRESRDLPNTWDRTVLYTPAVEADDVGGVVAWLHAFDELEGPGAVELLRSLANADDPLIRMRVAHALASCPIRANVTLAILTSLAADNDLQVRTSAMSALAAYEASRIVTQTDVSAAIFPSNTSASSSTSSISSSSTALSFAIDTLLVDPLSVEEYQAIRQLFDRVLRDPHPVPLPLLQSLRLVSDNARWLRDAVARHVCLMRDAALSRPDLPDLSHVTPALLRSSADPWEGASGSTVSTKLGSPGDHELWSTSGMEAGAHLVDKELLTLDLDGKELAMEQPEEWSPGIDGVVGVERLKSAAPLVDSLRYSEIHGICAIGLLAAAYEVFATVSHESLPLKFLGLGWLLAVGGLVAYPNSARLWSSFSRMIEHMPRVEP